MADLLGAFNSEEYGFKDLNVVMLGRPIIGLRGVRFKVKRDKGNVHGAGTEPIARTRGNKDYEGSIKILMSELVALFQSQGNSVNDVTDIRPFDIIVAFAPEVGDVITTFILKYVEFTECEVNVNQGDQQIEIDLPIIIGKIENNV
jgi:hypothetical protein